MGTYRTIHQFAFLVGMTEAHRQHVSAGVHQLDKHMQAPAIPTDLSHATHLKAARAFWLDHETKEAGMLRGAATVFRGLFH